jgi:DNA-binding CsgD family transcriptional regulator
MPHKTRTISGSSRKNHVSYTDAINGAIQTNQKTSVTPTWKACSEDRGIRPNSFGGGWPAHRDRKLAFAFSVVDGRLRDIIPGAVPFLPQFVLTPRELEVVQCILRGLSNREIAEHFEVSPRMVAFYLYRIMDKLGVSSHAELALLAAPWFGGQVTRDSIQ